MKLRWILAWTVAGGALAFSLLAMMTVGLFLLPFAVAAVTLLAGNPRARPTWPATFFGVGLPLLYVAYLNRGGPGEVCHRFVDGESCTEEFSPWPWLIAGALVVGIAVALIFRTHSRERTT